MEKFDWLLVIVFVVIASYAAYTFLGGYFFATPLSLTVDFSHAALGAQYPFQNIDIPLTINNTGSSVIENMNLQIYINSNTYRYYTVTLPVGKSATINFNFTPSSDGPYVLSAVADPGKVYSISDRDSAQSTVQINITAPEKAEPYVMLSAQNETSRGDFDGTPLAFDLAMFAKNEYGINPLHSPQLTGFDGLFWPLFNLTQTYIRNVSMAYAGYSNGNYDYSVWLRAYLTPSVMKNAENGYGLNASYMQIGNLNVTFANLDGGSICSWYSEGWIKILAYGNGSCSAYLGTYNQSATFAGIAQTAPINLTSDLSDNSTGSEFNATYSYASGNSFATGVTGILGSDIVMPIVSSNANTSTRTCYGIINTVGNESECSTDIFPLSGNDSNTSAVLTTRFTPAYNVSILSFINTGSLLSDLPYSEQYVAGLNLSGQSVEFVSGFQNTCSFSRLFGCTNPNFTNSTFNFELASLNGSKITIAAMECYSQVAGNGTSTSLEVGTTPTPVSVECYNGATRISGVALDLGLTLKLQYMVGNSTKIVNGTAEIFGV